VGLDEVPQFGDLGKKVLPGQVVLRAVGRGRLCPTILAPALLWPVFVDTAGLGGRLVKGTLLAPRHFPDFQAFLRQDYGSPLPGSFLFPGPQGVKIIPVENFLLQEREVGKEQGRAGTHAAFAAANANLPVNLSVGPGCGDQALPGLNPGLRRQVIPVLVDLGEAGRFFNFLAEETDSSVFRTASEKVGEILLPERGHHLPGTPG